MHLAGETEIAATRQRVWSTISNPSGAAASNSAGQAQIEKIDDRNYKVTITPTGSPMPMTVILNLSLTELDEPSHLAASIEGMMMGSPISGSGTIDLVEVAPKQTQLTWVADATLAGMLGGFDAMIQGPIQGAADKLFVSLKQRLEAEEAASAG